MTSRCVVSIWQIDGSPNQVWRYALRRRFSVEYAIAISCGHKQTVGITRARVTCRARVCVAARASACGRDHLRSHVDLRLAADIDGVHAEIARLDERLFRVGLDEVAHAAKRAAEPCRHELALFVPAHDAAWDR